MAENDIWTTQDGRRIPVIWMQTPHLIHSFNLIMRKNNLRIESMHQRRVRDSIIGTMHKEICARGFEVWVEGRQIAKVKNYETPAQLCFMRALFDTAPEYDITIFFKDPEQVMAYYLQNPRQYPKTLAKFAEYRLDHHGL